MNKKALMLGFLSVIFLSFSGMAASAQQEQAHKYMGVSRCKMCHMSEAKGNQYKHWEESLHAKAYETLASQDAKDIAKERGMAIDPQQAPECLKCHVTAYGLSKGLKAETFKDSDGVQCESCHGAGSDYAVLSIMQDVEKAKEAGLILPTKEVCVKCHNPESPRYKEFDFEKFFKIIAHPRPKK